MRSNTDCTVWNKCKNNSIKATIFIIYIRDNIKSFKLINSSFYWSLHSLNRLLILKEIYQWIMLDSKAGLKRKHIKYSIIVLIILIVLKPNLTLI